MNQLSQKNASSSQDKTENMCYTKCILSQVTTRKCFQCGSPLIFVSEVTEQQEGVRFPQTTIIYRCSNQACQDAKDKETAKRIKLREEKALADEKRIKKIQERRQQSKLEKLEKTKND